MSMWLAAMQALIPAAVVSSRRSSVPRSGYWFAAAFGVSLLADVCAAFLPGLYTWYPGLVLAPVQLGLFAVGLTSLRVGFVVAGITCGGMLMAGSIPDVWGVTTGSLIVCLLAYRSRNIFRYPVLMYCGGGTIFYLLMAANLDTLTFMPWWHGYQLTRLASIGLFAWIVWRKL